MPNILSVSHMIFKLEFYISLNTVFFFFKCHHFVIVMTLNTVFCPLVSVFSSHMVTFLTNHKRDQSQLGITIPELNHHCQLDFECQKFK